MQIEGKIENISVDAVTRKKRITILTDANVFLEEMQELKLFEVLTITFERYIRKRSLNANALFWSCVGKLAKQQGLSKWDVYLQLLRWNENFEYVKVKPSAVKRMRRQWRETEVMGEIELEGEKMVVLKCYYGSSTYDVDEFKCLLELTFEEMENNGLVPPSMESMQRSLELWESQQSQS